jgi:hypothetical protein
MSGANALLMIFLWQFSHVDHLFDLYHDIQNSSHDLNAASIAIVENEESLVAFQEITALRSSAIFLKIYL